MLTRCILAGSIALLSLTGCAESNANPAPQEVSASPTPDGQQRIADLDVEAQDCPQECGVEARSGLYADCVAEGGEQRDCGRQARVWYRECLESRCSEEDLKQDDCKTSCRMDGQEAREECMVQLDDEPECRARTQDAVQECLAECI